MPVKVLLTGGGTGGHITPLLAVADELKKQAKQTSVIYVGEKHGKFAHLTDGHTAIDEVYSVSCGKFRRYHKQAWYKRLLDLPTNLQNIRDVFLVISGIIQSWWLLGRIKPDVVFLKGGYVGVPVGLASVLRGIPFITHDSDALPGLANRLVSRWAKLHATALPASSYRYPKHKTRQVGVIVAQEYKAVNNRQARIYKKRLRLPDSAPLLLITGGSLGAARLNKSLVTTAKKLLVEFETLQIIHQVGKGKAGVYGNFSHDRLQVMEFLSPMFVFTGAADVIVTRAGANTMAELGTQAKACIVVPNPDLTGGHQLKNANALESKNAIIVIKESDIAERLHPMIIELLNNPSERLKLGKQHKKATVHNAARQLASILLTIRKRK